MSPDDLRAHRQKLGLSQKRLAEALGVPVRTVERWESTSSSAHAIAQPRILERALRDLERELVEDRLSRFAQTALGDPTVRLHLR